MRIGDFWRENSVLSFPNTMYSRDRESEQQ